jgi:RimJ/RimL family protein N-acetyltransferase
VTISLRPTKHEDIRYVIQAEQSLENRSFVGQWSESEHLSSLNNNDLLHLIVERTSDNEPVGYIILAGFENQNQSIEFRRIVVTKKGVGYGRAALKAVKRMAFEKFQAHRLWLDVREFNQRAQNLYISEGFQVEGILRECVTMEDRFESLIIMSMLASEYDGN